MKERKFLCLILVLFSVQLFGQSDSEKALKKYSKEEINSAVWITYLYDQGITERSDTIHLSEEFKKALVDTSYRKLIYPKRYRWETAKQLLKDKKFKPFFWYLLNLYHLDKRNKEMVLRLILPFQSMIDMEKVLAGSFYTYCYQDPLIGTVIDGKPEISRPDILEAKLRSLKELATYTFLVKAEIVKTQKK